MTFKRWSVVALAVVLAGLSWGAVPAAATDEDGVDTKPPGDMPCDKRPFSIQVTVLGVKSAKGLITIDLHDDDPERWLKKGGRVGRVRVPAVEGQTVVCVPVDHAGTYAFALYHDKDANLKLNKNWIGLPSEPFAVSNNAPIRLGPPSHKDASLQVTGPLTPATVTLSNY